MRDVDPPQIPIIPVVASNQRGKGAQGLKVKPKKNGSDKNTPSNVKSQAQKASVSGILNREKKIGTEGTDGISLDKDGVPCARERDRSLSPGSTRRAT